MEILQKIDFFLQRSAKREIFNIEQELKLLFDQITRDKKISPTIIEIILYIFSELADNIKEHSKASYWQMDFCRDVAKITIFVADNGIGIPALFSRHFPQSKGDDWDKISQALERGLSTKGEGRGFGLRTIKQLVEISAGEMIFISGKAGFLINKDKKEKIKSSYQGTVILIQFPANAIMEKDQFYKVIGGKND